MGVHPIYARLQNAFSFEKIANMTVGLRILMIIFLVIPYMSWMFFVDIFRYLWIGSREHNRYAGITATMYHLGFTLFLVWFIWKDPLNILAAGPGFLKVFHDSFAILSPILEPIDKFIPQSIFVAGGKWLCNFFTFTGVGSIFRYLLFYLFSGPIIVFAMGIILTTYWPLIVFGIIADALTKRMPLRDVVWDSIVFIKDTIQWNFLFIKDALTIKEAQSSDEGILYDDGGEWDRPDMFTDDEDDTLPALEDQSVAQPAIADVKEEESEPEVAQKIVPGTFSDSVEEARAKLDRMIGLQEVKDEINTLLNTQIIHQARADSGLKSTNVLSHMVFVGGPGTGKTTVARVLGDIYRNMGLLRTGLVVETARQQLVGAYIGEAALKTEAVVKKALGGILFIDEAYTLAKEESANDFGQEAIDTILKMMEDHRGEFIVVVAGYPNDMQRFITSNPGLRSRFQTVIHFNDYNASDLRKIFVLNAQADDYTPSNGCMKIVSEYLEEKRNESPDTFANGRDVRNIYQQIVKEQSNRLVREGGLADKANLQLLKTEDARAAVNVLSGQIF